MTELHEDIHERATPMKSTNGGGTFADDAALDERETAEPVSIAALARRLLDNGAILIRKELALATAEVLQSVQEARNAIGGMISGTAVLYAGFIFLLLAATLSLAQVVEAWVAALVVGAAATLVGLIMLLIGKRKLRPTSFAPERTADSLRKDREMIRRQTP